MLTDRIRVLPPFDSRGTVIYHGAIGVLVGVMNGIFFGAYATMLMATPFPRLTAMALSMAIPAILAWRLAGKSQRWALLVGCGFAYGAFAFLGAIVWSIFERPVVLRSGALLERTPVLALWMLISVLQTTIVFLAVAAAFRILRYRISVQDGTLCWSCGYPIAYTPGAQRCSECGTDIAGTRPQPRMDRIRLAVKPFAWPVAIVVAVAVVVFVTLLGYRERSEFAPLIAGVAHDEIVEEWMWGLHPQAGEIHWATGVRRELVRGSGIDLYVLHEPNPTHGVPPMQLRLLTPLGREIVAHLSAEQAQRVLMNDVPESLIDEMMGLAKVAHPYGWNETVMSPPDVRRHFVE